MECNKDEATRAKEIAERKFTARQIGGAKKFALKAQNLYPGLEGLAQMLAALDVHLAAENRINGEMNWYGVLGVDPLADDETVKKQYRKLALMLHPDKNKCVGSDEAFKMIAQAWDILSDKTKRIAYDRISRPSQQNGPSASGGASAPSASNGFHNTINTASPKMGAQRSNARIPPPRVPKHTFWTACHECKMQYEYLRVYLNHNLLCPNCHKPFLAQETAPPPSNGSKSSNPPWHSQTRPSSTPKGNKNAGSARSPAPDSFNQTNLQWSPFSRTAGVGSAAASASQATTLVQQAYETARRTREEAEAATKRKETGRKRSNVSKRAASNLSAGFSNTVSRPDAGGERPAKRRNLDNDGKPYNDGVNVSDQKITGNGGTGLGGASGFKQGGLNRDRANVSSAFINKPDSIRDLSQLELRNMLAEKARREILKKLDEWRFTAAEKYADKLENQKEVEEKPREQKQVASNGNTSNQIKLVGSADPKKGVHDKKAFLDTSTVDLLTEVKEPVTITVPDPDFHDFDRDRSERSFAENQVWAAYDDDDGMPRYYALIHKVISFNPFKMRISWLNSKTNNELGPLNWVGSGFPKICGDFRVGRYEINNSLNSFSHKVKWTKGTRGVVKIFPKKGDVWALYRNWSPDWNELTPDAVIHKYNMVEVLDDYEDEQSVLITPLVKVAGFKTVFHRHLDEGEIKRIPKEEMFRFSHQVPSYLLTGSEAPNAPKGCRELDPAATPVELLQIITEVKEDEIMDSAKELTTTETAKVEIVEHSGGKEVHAKEEVIVDNAEVQVAEIEKEKETVKTTGKQMKEAIDVILVEKDAEQPMVTEVKAQETVVVTAKLALAGHKEDAIMGNAEEKNSEGQPVC